MLVMFWTRESNTVQELFELTREHRYEDPWLSALLLRERHGNMEHELYCFMHRFPTKHTGSWMPDSNDVLCGERRCRALPAEWERALSTGTPQIGNSDVLRNAMFSNIIAYNESVFSAMKKIVSLRT